MFIFQLLAGSFLLPTKSLSIKSSGGLEIVEWLTLLDCLDFLDLGHNRFLLNVCFPFLTVIL